jgi:hypothetical protein
VGIGVGQYLHYCISVLTHFLVIGMGKAYSLPPPGEETVLVGTKKEKHPVNPTE